MAKDYTGDVMKEIDRCFTRRFDAKRPTINGMVYTYDYRVDGEVLLIKLHTTNNRFPRDVYRGVESEINGIIHKVTNGGTLEWELTEKLGGKLVLTDGN